MNALETPDPLESTSNTDPPRPIQSTPAVRDVALTADFVLPRREVMVVHGALGTGRTTAVTAHLQSQQVPWHRIDLPPNQNAIKINTWLYRQIATKADLPLRDLQDDLVEALAEEDRIVVVRHAERLTAEAAGQLQWLHAHPDTRFALILIGDQSVGPAVQRDPLLVHAISGTVHVKALTDRALLRVLQGLHPLFLNADPQLLEAIDAQVCHGNLGRWTKLLDRVQWFSEHDPATPVGGHPHLDKRLAQAAIASLPKLPTRKT
ncbi:MAG: AAA family ATPase [Ornithinimicrobium sp.]